MPRKPAPPSNVPGKPRRGRPPKPGGRIPQVEVQRAYRARLKAAGKIVRIVDANAVPVPDFDPARDGVFERAMFESMQDRLRNALLKLELRKEELARLRERNAWLERELFRLEREVTNALKGKISLERQLAARRR